MIETALKQCKNFNNAFDSEERLFRLSALRGMLLMFNSAMGNPCSTTYEVRNFKVTRISFDDEHYTLDNGDYRLL